MGLNIVISIILSSVAGVLFDFMYKWNYPMRFTDHKLYLDNARDVIIGLFFNSIVNFIISIKFYISKGIFYKRGFVQFFMIIIIFILINL
jgi:hypothetical protein